VFDSQAAFLWRISTSVWSFNGRATVLRIRSKRIGRGSMGPRAWRAAGLGSDTLPGASALYLPLVGSKGPIGVLAVRPTLATRFLDLEQLHLLEVLAKPDRPRIGTCPPGEEAQQAHVSVEQNGCAMPSSVPFPTSDPFGDHYRSSQRSPRRRTSLPRGAS
jgi:two-component system sensor histidine kinase KdpD